MAAEMAGVSYTMAYKVRIGTAQSKRVEQALKICRQRLLAKTQSEKKIARERLRALRAEARSIEKRLRMLKVRGEAA
jgi:hypothetical protein